MGAEARLSCVYVQMGLKKKKSGGAHTHLPRPPLPTPSLPPWLLWPAPLCASQGRGLSQLGVLGCVAACLYWSVDFLVAACTYLNIPPGHCSVFPASHSPPPPPHLNRLLCLTPSFLLYHSFVPLSNLLFYFPSLPCALFFFFSLDCFLSHGFFCTFTPDSILMWMREKAGWCGLGKKCSTLIYRRLYSTKQLYSWFRLVWTQNNSTHLRLAGSI